MFPGGFGTLDELFEVLNLRQTNRIQPMPIILFHQEYWNRVIDFQFLADEGVIADEHLELFSYAETPEAAWDIIQQFHRGTSEHGAYAPAPIGFTKSRASVRTTSGAVQRLMRRTQKF